MEKKNYFNSIPWREARLQLGHCRFMAKEEFADGTKALQGKKIVMYLYAIDNLRYYKNIIE